MHVDSSAFFRHRCRRRGDPIRPRCAPAILSIVSGQGPIDPVTDQLSPGDIQHETRLVLANIRGF